MLSPELTCVDYTPDFIKPRVEKGEQLHFTLEPVYWFHIETVGNGSESGESRLWWEGALGYEGNQLYFCGPVMDYRGWRALHPEQE